MNNVSANIVLAPGCISFEKSWCTLKALVEKYRVPIDNCELYRKTINYNSIEKRLRKERVGYQLNLPYYSFNHSIVKRYNHELIRISFESSDSVEPLIPWKDVLMLFSSLEGFVQSWIVDQEFNYWQNSELPSDYVLDGRSVEGLEMVSNEYGEERIDISKNPGRRVLKDGYVEAIGSEMCFSQKFWEKIGKSPKVLENLDHIEISSSESCCSNYIKISNDPFTLNTGLEYLTKLRNTLFAN